VRSSAPRRRPQFPWRRPARANRISCPQGGRAYLTHTLALGAFALPRTSAKGSRRDDIVYGERSIGHRHGPSTEDCDDPDADAIEWHGHDCVHLCRKPELVPLQAVVAHAVTRTHAYARIRAFLGLVGGWTWTPPAEARQFVATIGFIGHQNAQGVAAHECAESDDSFPQNRNGIFPTAWRIPTRPHTQ
jgi:hypothetical protein